MFKFYFFLWLYWVYRMLFVTLFLASFLALSISAVLYVKQGMPAFSAEVNVALFEIFSFWFLLALNLAIVLAFFINTKYIFNHCIDGVCVKLLSCPKDGEVEIIENIGYGDLVKVWRRWLMLIVWISAVFMLFSVAFSYVFSSYDSIFDWFSVYLLYGFITLSGFVSIVLMLGRCKQMRVGKC